MRQRVKPTLILAGVLCLSMLAVGKAGSFPRNPGTYDEDKLGKQKEAQKVLEDLNLKLSIESDDIVRIGQGFTVGPGETIEGDIVIIGGGLTVKGTIEGDAVVVGGSMYLASTAVVDGDAAVIGGILQMEDGATVRGEVTENVETTLSPYLSDIHEKKGEERPRSEPMGDIVKFGESVHVLEGETVDGDVVSIGGGVRIDGHVTGDVVTTAGDITIGSTGYAEGDVVATFGKVTIEPGGVAEGEVTEVSLGGVKTTPRYVCPETCTGDEVTYVISLRRPDADEVKLTGSFIDWDEDGIEMERDHEGTWKTTITLGPGSYQYKFIVDGQWIHDPDMEEKVPDGRGGYATPIIVKSKAKMKEERKDGAIIFSLERPEADEVRIIGSWNDWDPDGIVMERDGDTFRTKVSLPAGMHTYKFCIDGRCIPDPDEPDKLVKDRYGDRMTSVIVKPKGWDRVLIHFLHDRPDVSDMRLTGSFNDWDSEGIPMYKNDDGIWFTYVALPVGTHQYKFYIDGVWGPDPDVEETVPDGRGGRATEFEVKPPRKRQGVTVTTTIEEWKERQGFDFTPAFDYNRVDGVYIAGMIHYGSRAFPEPSFYVEGGYSKKRDRGLYKIELEQPMYEPLDLWIGGSIYDLTATYDRERITDWENLVATLFRFDYRDYFDHRGVAGFARISPGKHHSLKLAYMGDEYRPLERKAHATLFGGNRRFPENPRSSYQISYDPEWEAATCDLVKIRALELAYEYDDRDCKKTPTFGFLVRLSGEWARQDWGGDLDYSRYLADIRRYHKISSKQLVGIKFAAGVMDIPDKATCGCVPKAQYFFPKQFAVGGIGTLPGYPYKEFRGTHLLLANLEYNYLVKDQLGILFFTDAGDAKGESAALNGTWDVGDVWETMKIKFDAGVAVRFESTCDFSLTLGVVQRLDDLDKGSKVIIRGSRTF